MRSWQRRLAMAAFVLSGQGLLLLMAVLIGVMDPVRPEETGYTVPADDQTRQERQRMEAIQQQLAQFNRLQQSLPDRSMEKLTEALHPIPESNLPALGPSLEAMGSLLEQQLQPQLSGAGVPMGQSADLPPPAPVEFLGEQIQARRIVLLMDVSASVKSKLERADMPMGQLREEVLNFIDQLGPDHLFGIIQFTRKWEAFRPELLPATAKVKESARDWMRSAFRTNGTAASDWATASPNGIEAVLNTAFEMSPQIDEIFLLSDGDFQRSLDNGGGQDVPWQDLRTLTKALQSENLGEARLRLLCFYPPDHAIPQLREWARENGNGHLRIWSAGGSSN
jgi:hypothetical protein